VARLVGAFYAGSLALVAVVACARTDLDPSDLEVGESRVPNTASDASVEDVEVPVEDAAVDVEIPIECEPSAEECNGVDDDCNGEVDDVPPIPCPDGGFQYCVAGHFSGCPTRCDACVPGSETICFVSYCYFWGVQTCASDGKSLSGCVEEPPPSACRDIASEHQKSRQLEQCCVDQGHCCKDDFDLDGDGDRNDYVGNCSEVVCGE